MSGLIVAALLIAAVLIVIIIRQPDEFKVTRKATINAAAPVVFEHINDMHKWQAWSPWARMDPEAKGRFAGPEKGIGASFHWEGKKTGAGTMTIAESRPHELVKFRLNFEKPMKATNTAEFILTPLGQQTEVSWSMYGPVNFIGKTMGLFMNCEKIVGGQFEDGFKNLNQVVESR